jgi:hypothetical protein
MTTLPQVPDIEAQALAFAKDRLTEFPEGFPRENNRIFAREMLKDYARYTTFGMSNLMHDARCGWEDAHLALVEMIADYKRKDQKLPPQLASYSIDAINPYLPPRPRGPNKASNVMRNIVVVSIIDELVQKFGLHAVRNRSSRAPRRRPSACAILARALADEQPAGQALGERAVELIWERFRHWAFARRDEFNRMLPAIPAGADVPQMLFYTQK